MAAATAAGGGASALLSGCINTLKQNTAHPERFLSLQDGAAADFTSLAKTLYDLAKTQETADSSGSLLAELLVESFDEEQIWQELELQNTAMLTHFGSKVHKAAEDETLTLIEEEEEEEEAEDAAAEEMEDDDGEEEEDEKTPAKRPRRKAVKRQDDEDLDDEDSDVDFDVDELEKREKQRKPAAAATRKGFPAEPSEVDDRFFKLAEMESFLDDMDKQEDKEQEDGVDYFQDIPSDNEGDEMNLENLFSAKKQTKKRSLKSSRNLKYKDFFDPVAGESPGAGDRHGDGMDEMQEDSEEDLGEEEEEEEEEEGSSEDEEGGQSREGHKKVTFNLPREEESEGEDVADILGGKAKKKEEKEKEERKSTFEKRQEKMTEKIRELEKVALSDKPWQLAGEATAQSRPENSMLGENVDFEQTSRKAPAITEETTLQLEDIIKQRIKDQVFDDVVRKEKPKEEAFQYKKRLTLDHEKSKLSLAQIYEQEFLKQAQKKTEVEENPAHLEIKKMMDTLFLKLDALSNFHFTPKPAIPEVKVVSNLPSISMEEVAPVSTSDATLLAPEEVKDKNKAGDVLGDSEKTQTDKKRQRRKKKTVKRVKIQERERRQKLRDASAPENDKRKLSKSQVAERLQKVTKGGKATVLKDEGKDKALRSSQAFFSELQDQVRTQIKDAKSPAAKKKRKEMSASKLKL